MVDRDANGRGIPPALLPLLSVTSISVGFTLAKHLFPVAGPGGIVALRIGFAAAALLCLWRPRPRRLGLPRDPRTLVLILAWGTAMAGTNWFVFHAMELLPVGIAVTIEFLGPLTVAIAGSRRRLDLLWAALAGSGVYLITGGGGGRVQLLGGVFALVGGACWGAYIVFNAAVGARTSGGHGLALAIAWAALLVVPAGVAEVGSALATPMVLLGGLGVAVACSLVPYSVDLEALRRIPQRVFGVLMSLEPAVAALAGLLILGEALQIRQWFGIACVIAASMGATRTPGPPGRRVSST